MKRHCTNDGVWFVFFWVIFVWFRYDFGTWFVVNQVRRGNGGGSRKESIRQMSVTHIERKNKLLANQNLNQLERSTTATWRTPYYELVINLLRFDIFLLWKRYDRPITTANRLSEREWEQVLLLEQTYKDVCSFFSIFSPQTIRARLLAWIVLIHSEAKYSAVVIQLGWRPRAGAISLFHYNRVAVMTAGRKRRKADEMTDNW